MFDYIYFYFKNPKENFQFTYSNTVVHFITKVAFTNEELCTKITALQNKTNNVGLYSLQVQSVLFLVQTISQPEMFVCICRQ